MFFYSRLTNRKKGVHGPPLVSHRAGEKIKEVIGEGIQGFGRGAQQQEVRGRDSEARRRMDLHNREEIMKELDELKRLFDSIILHVREPKSRERVATVFRLIHAGIEGGGIRSPADIRPFFRALFNKKPQNAEEAQEVYKEKGH